MQMIDSFLNESRERWGLSQAMVRWIFLLPFISTLIIVLTRVYKPLFRFLLVEDGVFEWFTFVCLLATAIFSFLVGLQLRSLKHPWQASLFILFGLAMFFAAGEEITWGQRVLGWETPEHIQAINEQGETNLHNLEGVLSITNLVMLSMGLYGVFAWIVARAVHPERWWYKADLILIPPVFLIGYFFFLAGFRLTRLFFEFDSSFTINRIAEWSEFLTTMGLVMYLWLIWQHLKGTDS